MSNQFEKTQPDIRANGDTSRPGTNPNEPSTWDSKTGADKKINNPGKQPGQHEKDDNEKEQQQSG